MPKQKHSSSRQAKPKTAAKTRALYSQPLPAVCDPADTAKEEPIGHTIAPAHFELRDDGSVEIIPSAQGGKAESSGPQLIYRSESPFVRLYQGNCLELLDAIAVKYPEGRFDAIFADPPYFLSNGGITCHAGKMVKVDKDDWDQ